MINDRIHSLMISQAKRSGGCLISWRWVASVKALARMPKASMTAACDTMT